MSDPKRLLDLEDDPILRAGLDDGAPPGVEERMLAGLGLATAAAAAATTTTAATAATTTTKAVAKLGLVKWIAVSAVVATAATGGVLVTRAPEGPVPATSAVPSSSSSSLARPDRALSDVPPPPPPVAPPSPEPVVAPPAPRPLVVAPSAPPAPSVAAPSTLSDELALLAEANAAVQRRDSAAATSALDRYDAKYARGSLSVEAEALRIETLALTDEPRAREKAKAFLARHPSSPASRAVRRIAEGGN